MIEELTLYQEAKLKEYRDKYIDIGLNTDRIDKEACVRDINLLYEKILTREKVPVVVLDNPVACCMEVKKTCYGGDHAGDPVIDQFSCHLFRYKDIYLEGCFAVDIFAFYDYMLEVLNVKIDNKTLEKYRVWKSIINYGLIFPLDNVCYVSEKPTLIKLDKDGRLHSDDGPALKYDGGLELYFKNGDNVSK